MAKIVAVTNQKGGVGKTTVSFNLGKGLTKLGHKVLLVDNDPQGNLTTSVLENPEDLRADILNIYKENFDFQPQTISKNLDFIGATINLAEITDNMNVYLPHLLKGYLKENVEGDDSKKIEDCYDYIIIDCLPSFGPLNVAALLAADYVLIPTKPAPYAIDGLVSLFGNIEKMRKRNFNSTLKVVGIVMNLVENTKIHKELEVVLKEEYPEDVFEVKIDKGTRLEESPFFNESVMEYAPGTKQAKQFKAFIREFLRRIA